MILKRVSGTRLFIENGVQFYLYYEFPVDLKYLKSRIVVKKN